MPLLITSSGTTISLDDRSGYTAAWTKKCHVSVEIGPMNGNVVMAWRSKYFGRRPIDNGDTFCIYCLQKCKALARVDMLYNL